MTKIYLARNVEDVSLSGLQNNDYLRYDSATETWIPSSGSGGGGSPVDVQENDSTIVSNVEVLNFEGSVEVTDEGSNKATITITASGGGASALDDLTDVILTTSVSGEILQYNGTNWINAPLGSTTNLVDIGARVYNSTDIEISDSSQTPITFNSERWDTDNIHSTITNTTRLTCQTAGKYLIVGQVYWEGYSSGYRQVAIKLNGTTEIATIRNNNIGNDAVLQEAVTTYDLDIGNYVELVVYQTSTVALDIISATNISPEFGMQLLNTTTLDELSLTVQEDDIVTASGVSIINFEGGVTTLDEGDGKVTITITASGEGASALNDLTDVTISGVTVGNHLQYDGSNWINAPLGSTTISGWIDYSDESTIVGWSSYTSKQIYYKKVGSTVQVIFNIIGTSDAITATFTLPHQSTIPAIDSWVRIQDNGGTWTTGLLETYQSNTMNLYPTAGGGNWTAASTKGARGQFIYRIDAPEEALISTNLVDIGARVNRSTDQTIPNDTNTAVSFDTEYWDTDNIWAIGTPTRLTCQTAGKYHIYGGVAYEYNTTGIRDIRIRLNGTTIIAHHRANAATRLSWAHPLIINTVYDLDVDDYVELVVLHDAGTDLDLLYYAYRAQEFGMQLIGTTTLDELSLTVQEDDIVTASGVTTLNFEGSAVTTSNDGNGKVTVTISGGSTINSINDINDVTISGVTVGDHLQYDGSGWINAPLGSTTISGWIDYSDESTIVGWSSFTDKYIYYKKVGSTVYVTFELKGTSNSDTVTFTLPYDSIGSEMAKPDRFQDNGGTFAVGITVLNPDNNPNLVTCFPTTAGGSWTASNTKVVAGQFFYQIDAPEEAVITTNLVDIGARVYRNSNQTITNATYTPIEFNTENYDTDNIHSTTTNTSRLTCRTAGKYYIWGSAAWDDTTTGDREIYIYLNGTEKCIGASRQGQRSGGWTHTNVSTIYDLDVNDYVEIVVWQNSGGDESVRWFTGYGDATAQDSTPAGGMQLLGTTTLENYAPVTEYLAQGRLTVSSGIAIPTTDVTGATSLYYTQYNGDKITLYNGSQWEHVTFDEPSLSLTGLTASTPYDIFATISGTTMALASTAWTNDTTRATELTRQNGVYVKSGTPTNRYLGTIYINSTGGQTDDSYVYRFVWNYYNRVLRIARIGDNTYHSYSTATWRNWNNDSTIRVFIVQGIIEEPTNFVLSHRGQQGAIAAIAIDNTFPFGMEIGFHRDDSSWNQASAEGDYYPSIGYHYWQVRQYAVISTADYEDVVITIRYKG